MVAPDIKGIVFDCFGVLYHSSIEHLLSITPEEHRVELLDASHASDLGYLTHDEYFARVAELTSKTPKEAEEIVRAQHVRNDEVFNILRKLRGRYKTAMLSNIGAHVIDQLFTQDELQELFDTVVLSSSVGMVKPYPEIFEYTVTQLGLHPSECVMIDDRSENVEGAISTDMLGIIFTSAQQLEVELQRVLDGTEE